jgi:DNA-binding SARP family transcriptional activator
VIPENITREHIINAIWTEVPSDNARFNVSEIKELNGITHEVIKDAI